MFELVFVNSEISTIALDKPIIKIGRDRRNDLVLNQEGVSGFHAEFHLENNQLYILDVESTNGTFVNGERIYGKKAVEPWSKVKFDDIEAEIRDTKSVKPTTIRKVVTDQDLPKKVKVAKSWVLVGESNPVKQKTFPIADKMSIGRSPENDIRIDHEMVSSKHAELKLSGEILIIRDLESTNGTFVNGTKITETILKPGDEIRFDEVMMRLDGPTQPVTSTRVRPAVKPEKTTVRPAAIEQKNLENQIVTSRKTSIAREAHYSIGRNPTSDILTDHDSVSWNHSRISLEGDLLYITDLGSNNGTYVNDRRIAPNQPILFHSGDQIRIGAVPLPEDVIPLFLSGNHVTQVCVPTTAQTLSPKTPTEVIPPPKYPTKGCVYCGSEIPESAMKCQRCGEWVAQQKASPEPADDLLKSSPQITTKICPYCGSEIPESAQKCQRCGEWLDQRKATSTPPGVNVDQNVNQAVEIKIEREESITFAIVTLLCYIFIYPVGLLLNIIGLITGPKKGCFVSMIIVCLLLPLFLFFIVIYGGVSIGVPFIENLFRYLEGIF